jgi:hypothetical protein
MIATLLATMFTGAAILALGTMMLTWLRFGPRFPKLRAELRITRDPVTVRFAWRDHAGHDRVAPRGPSTVYNLDFKAKADALPFHPELHHDLPVAA